MPFPTSPAVGAVFTAANGSDYIYTSKGAWKLKNGPVATSLSWTTATRPTSPVVGQSGFNSTTGKVEVWDGSKWGAIGANAMMDFGTKLFETFNAAATWDLSSYANEVGAKFHVVFSVTSSSDTVQVVNQADSAQIAYINQGSGCLTIEVVSATQVATYFTFVEQPSSATKYAQVRAQPLGKVKVTFSAGVWARLYKAN